MMALLCQCASVVRLSRYVCVALLCVRFLALAHLHLGVVFELRVVVHAFGMLFCRAPLLALLVRLRLLLFDSRIAL